MANKHTKRDVIEMGKIYHFTTIRMAMIKRTENNRDFPGGPVVKTACCHCRGCRFDPWSSLLGEPRFCMPLSEGKTKQNKRIENNRFWDFPGDAVVKTPCSQCTGLGFDPWLGN